MNGGADLDIVLPNQVTEVVYVRREWITWRLHVLVFWRGLIATTEGCL